MQLTVFKEFNTSSKLEYFDKEITPSTLYQKKHIQFQLGTYCDIIINNCN